MAKGFGNMMRQAQQMQKKMAQISDELKNITAQGEAGQGQVKAEVTCDYAVKSVTIAKELADPDDTETLEDLIVLAVNDAMEKARVIKEEEMGKVTGGLSGQIPGLF
ncbi:Nucleoid-associated protein YaaK [hydrothermal vent metagenome]|uniref:Nucleoid-associated protein YaaK n=1 Tax=hydrothermal vent metagenome TaxID=652676 RepID=A0A3B1BWG8_9ZZZZ